MYKIQNKRLFLFDVVFMCLWFLVCVFCFSFVLVLVLTKQNQPNLLSARPADMSVATPSIQKDSAVKDADVSGTFEVQGLDADEPKLVKAACVVVKSGRMHFFEDATVCNERCYGGI